MEKSAHKSASRYKNDQELITEEENDGSSFLNPHKVHNREINLPEDDDQGS